MTDAAAAQALASADIVIGVHGAGLANAIYSRDGLVLVELLGGYGEDVPAFYQRVAASRAGAHVRLKLPQERSPIDGGLVVPAELARQVASCAVDAWRRKRAACEELRAHGLLVSYASPALEPLPAPPAVGEASVALHFGPLAPCEVSLRCWYKLERLFDRLGTARCDAPT